MAAPFRDARHHGSLPRPAGRSKFGAVQTLLRTVHEWDAGEVPDDVSDYAARLERPLASRETPVSTPSVASSGRFTEGERVVLPRIVQVGGGQRERRRVYIRLEDLEWHPRVELEPWNSDAEVAVELRRWASSWTETYYNVLDNTPSPSVAAELVLNHAETVTKNLGMPNPVLTAAACMLLDTLVPSTLVSPAHAHLAELVKTQIACSIYTTSGAVAATLGDTSVACTEIDVGRNNATMQRKILCMRRDYRDKQESFVDFVRREDDHSLVYPYRANERWFLQNYLKRLPFYEQHARSERHFGHFKKIIDTSFASVQGKRLLLQMGVTRWQHGLLRVMLNAWRTTVAWMRRANALLLSVNGRHRRQMVLRQRFTAWRIASMLSAASNRQQKGRMRIGELMQLDKELTLENESTEDIIAQVKEKIERVDEELVDASDTTGDDVARLDDLMTSERRWAGLAVEHAQGFTALKGVLSNQHFKLDDGRRAAENTLLQWAEETLTKAYGIRVTVQDFGTSWKSGVLLLAVMHYHARFFVTRDDLMIESATQRVELAAKKLGDVGIDVSPDHIYQAQTDVIVRALFGLWSKFTPPMSVGGQKDGRGLPRQRSFNEQGGGITAAESEDIMKLCDAELAWLAARHKLNQYCVYLLHRRAHGSPCEVLTQRQTDAMVRLFGDFTDFTYQHVCPWPCSPTDIPEASLAEVKQLFTEYFSDLRKVFLAYSQKGRMKISDYFKFLADAGLFTPQFKKPTASRLFARINLLNKEMGMGDASMFLDSLPQRTRSKSTLRRRGSERSLSRKSQHGSSVGFGSFGQQLEAPWPLSPVTPAGSNDVAPQSGAAEKDARVSAVEGGGRSPGLSVFGVDGNPTASPQLSAERGATPPGSCATTPVAAPLRPLPFKPPPQTQVDAFAEPKQQRKNSAADLEEFSKKFAKLDKTPAGGGAAVKGDEVLADKMDFDSSEFAQFLIHISMMRLPKKHKGFVDLYPALETLITEVIQCTAKDTPLVTFRKQLWDETVAEYVRPHSNTLEALFKNLSCRDAEAAKKQGGKKAPLDPNTLSLWEWRLCMDELLLYDGLGLTQASADAIYAQYTTGHVGDETMVFPEFEDAFCTLAVYRFRDPYVCVGDKVKAFLAAVMPAVERYVERHREESVLRRSTSRMSPMPKRTSASPTRFSRVSMASTKAAQQ